MEAKKVFISYSWSSQEHEERVLDLATDLRENGVDAILDKWDLREGEDADKFMESMVSDETISKVLIVSDKQYAAKSDKRKGGAGTEAQIISRKIYEQTDEKKFVVAAFEINEETGKPYLPVYYGSRKYIDFTDQSKQVEKFEELIRWINDKPLYVKPELGKTPEYILTDEKKSLKTNAIYRRAINLFSELKPNSSSALRDYLSTFADNLAMYQIRDWTGKQYDDVVLDSITEFLPYRDEWIEVLDCVLKNNPTSGNIDLYHKFFEKVHTYTSEVISVRYPCNCIEENIKFIEHELYLYYIATLIKYELFGLINYTLGNLYYNSNATNEFNYNYTYFDFQHYLYSINNRNEQRNLRRLSLVADIHKERSSNKLIEFDAIMQADFCLYLYYIIHSAEGSKWHIKRWYPDTLLYSRYRRMPFELFARSESKQYFNKMKVMFGIEDKQGIVDGFDKIVAEKVVYPTWDYHGFNYKMLSNIENLATI